MLANGGNKPGCGHLLCRRPSATSPFSKHLPEKRPHTKASRTVDDAQPDPERYRALLLLLSALHSSLQTIITPQVIQGCSNRALTQLALFSRLSLASLSLSLNYHSPSRLLSCMRKQDGHVLIRLIRLTPFGCHQRKGGNRKLYRPRGSWDKNSAGPSHYRTPISPHSHQGYLLCKPPLRLLTLYPRDIPLSFHKNIPLYSDHSTCDSVLYCYQG